MKNQLLVSSKQIQNHQEPQGFSCFFSQNDIYLNTYFKVREHCYRHVDGGPKDFDGSRDAYDEQADVIIVKYEDKVIGGARIVGSTRENRVFLPMESQNFQLNDIFPSYNLSEKGYCEFSRLAILKEYRSMELLNYVCGALIRKTIERGYDYLFAFTPLIQARTYRTVAHNLNLPRSYNIHMRLNAPQKDEKEVGDLKMYLSSLLLPSSHEMKGTSPLVYASDIRLRKAA